jgi:hypothetical protein
MFYIRRTLAATLLFAFILSPQTNILRIQVLEGEGAISTTGTRSSKPITILVTDDAGKPVEAAGVTFRLPEDGASGFFGSGLKSEIQITGPDGRASVWGINWTDTPGPVRIRVTAAKEQARAGIIISQYVAPPAKPGEPPPQIPKPASTPVSQFKPEPAAAAAPPPITLAQPPVKKHNRWWIIVLAGGGAAAAGVIAARGGGGSSATTGGGSSVGTVTTPPVSIGSPTITVGKP